jgi:hypothetical protein
MLGNGRLEAYCFDGKPRQCHIRGKMRKKARGGGWRLRAARPRRAAVTGRPWMSHPPVLLLLLLHPPPPLTAGLGWRR